MLAARARPASPVADEPRDGSGWTPRGVAEWSVLVGIVLVAFLIRAIPVLRGGGLDGYLGYDDGVYFASAVAFVNGVVPYQDLLLLHPPGIVLLLSPFAVLGGWTGDATAFAAARVAVMLLGAANTLLVSLVAGRAGRRAAYLAGALYAVWFAAARVERSTLLIAPQTTLLLIGVVILVSRRSITIRRAAAGGAAIGLTLAIQVWQVLPLLIVIGAFAWTWRGSPGGWRRPTLAALIGAAVAAGMVCLPFLVAAPGEFLRFVVVDQLARPTSGIPIVTRLRDIEGLPVIGHLGHLMDALVVGLAMGGAAAALVVARRLPVARMWCLLVAVELAYLLAVPAFITHYSGWIAPGAAIVLGTAASIVIGALDRDRWPGLAARVACIGLIAVVAIVTIPRRQGSVLPGAAIEADIRGASCVAADAPVLLIETTALRRDLRGGCPLILDPTGVLYDTDRGHSISGAVDQSRQAAPGYQRAMARYYGGADAALFHRLPADGLTAATLSEIARNLPVTIHRGAVTEMLRGSP